MKKIAIEMHHRVFFFSVCGDMQKEDVSFQAVCLSINLREESLSIYSNLGLTPSPDQNGLNNVCINIVCRRSPHIICPRQPHCPTCSNPMICFHDSSSCYLFIYLFFFLVKDLNIIIMLSLFIIILIKISTNSFDFFILFVFIL